MLEDLAPDAAHLLAPTLSLCQVGTNWFRGPTDVRLGDPAAGPRRLHGREVDPELLRDPPHQWRRLHARRGRLAAVLADHDQNRTDGRHLALGDQDARDLPGGGRRDLDRRLVGLDLDQRLVLGDLVALRDEPPGDLALGQPLAEVGQLEFVRHPAAEVTEADRSRNRQARSARAAPRRTA